MRVQLCFMHAVLGETAEARSHAEAIEPFRESLASDDGGKLLAAKALAEYATTM